MGLVPQDTPACVLHVSRFTFYVSRFTFHVSRFTFHVSRFTFHVSRFTFHAPHHATLRSFRRFIIPAAQSPFKPEREPTPPAERLRLLRLALAGKHWCEIDEQEIQRGGTSYTIDTVRDYTRRFPQAEFF